MLTRIGDLAQQQRLTGSMLSTQARTRADSAAIASGKAAASYREIPDRAGALLRAEDKRDLLDTSVRQNEQLLHKLQTMDTALGSLVGLAERARTQLVQRLNGATGDALPLDKEMASLLDQVAQQLSATHEGSYVFGGSATGAPPVELPAAGITTPDPTLFYRGDAVRASARIGAGEEVEYGILADEPAFATLIAGLGAAAQAHVADDEGSLATALDQLGTALDGIIERRSVLGVDTARVEAANDVHQSGLLYLDEAISAIADVDLAEVTTRLASDQATLEAAYLVTGRLSSLSLADFLR